MATVCIPRRPELCHPHVLFDFLCPTNGMQSSVPLPLPTRNIFLRGKLLVVGSVEMGFYLHLCAPPPGLLMPYTHVKLLGAWLRLVQVIERLVISMLVYIIGRIMEKIEKRKRGGGRGEATPESKVSVISDTRKSSVPTLYYETETEGGQEVTEGTDLCWPQIQGCTPRYNEGSFAQPPPPGLICMSDVPQRLVPAI